MLVVDNTILSAMAKCETQAAVRHVLGMSTEADRAALRAGQAAHAALAVWASGFSGGAMEVFAKEYREWAEEHVPRDDRLAYHNVAAILYDWLETHPVERFPVTIKHVEVPVHVLLATDVQFVGKLDALGQDESGKWWVVEHKTTGRITESWKGKWRLDSQLSGYVWAASEWLGQQVVGVMVNGIELSKLPGSDRKCRDHGVKYVECGVRHVAKKHEVVPVTRSLENMHGWRRTSLGLAERYRRLSLAMQEGLSVRNLEMQGTFNGSCQWCAFQDFCETERVGWNMLVEEPWDPMGRA